MEEPAITTGRVQLQHVLLLREFFRTCVGFGRRVKLLVWQFIENLTKLVVVKLDGAVYSISMQTGLQELLIPPLPSSVVPDFITSMNIGPDHDFLDKLDSLRGDATGSTATYLARNREDLDYLRMAMDVPNVAHMRVRMLASDDSTASLENSIMTVPSQNGYHVVAQSVAMIPPGIERMRDRIFSLCVLPLLWWRYEAGLASLHISVNVSNHDEILVVRSGAVTYLRAGAVVASIQASCAFMVVLPPGMSAEDKDAIVAIDLLSGRTQTRFKEKSFQGLVVIGDFLAVSFSAGESQHQMQVNLYHCESFESLVLVHHLILDGMCDGSGFFPAVTAHLDDLAVTFRGDYCCCKYTLVRVRFCTQKVGKLHVSFSPASHSNDLDVPVPLGSGLLATLDEAYGAVFIWGEGEVDRAGSAMNEWLVDTVDEVLTMLAWSPSYGLTVHDIVSFIAKVIMHPDRVAKFDPEYKCLRHEPATQEVQHVESPASPDPSDQLVAEIMWSQSVQLQVEAFPDGGTSQSSLSSDHLCQEWLETECTSFSEHVWSGQPGALESAYGDTIFVLAFTRSPTEFREALHSGRELESVRAEAKAAGLTCHLPSGASMFVYPNQYAGVKAVALKYELKAHHVIVNQAFLPLLLQEVRRLPSRSNVRPSSVQPLMLVDCDGSVDVCVVERTFINMIEGHHHHWDGPTTESEPCRKSHNPRRAHH